MLNNLNFLRAFAGQKVKDAAQSATAALVAFDPKGATEAQISLMEGQLDELGRKVASTQREYDDAKKLLTEAQTLKQKRLTAAENLQAQVDAGDKSKEGSVTKLVEIIESSHAELEGLKRDEADIGGYLKDLQTAYNAAAAKLKDARSQLGQAERGMKRAEIEQDRARDRAQSAAIAAGVHAGGDALNTALDAMKRKTAEAQDAAAAANLKASTLAPVDHEKDDPEIAAALAAASGERSKPQSTAERLAALRAA